MATKKWVYLFNEVEQAEKYVKGDWDQVRGLLGGKGANLAEMTRIKLPVPPFFTVTTEACNAYSATRRLPGRVCGLRLSNHSKKWKLLPVRNLAPPAIRCWFPAAPAQNSPCPV